MCASNRSCLSFALLQFAFRLVFGMANIVTDSPSSSTRRLVQQHQTYIMRQKICEQIKLVVTKLVNANE